MLEELIEPAESLAKYTGLCSKFNFLQNQPPAGAVEGDRKEWRFCKELQKINLVSLMCSHSIELEKKNHYLNEKIIQCAHIILLKIRRNNKFHIAIGVSQNQLGWNCRPPCHLPPISFILMFLRVWRLRLLSFPLLLWKSLLYGHTCLLEKKNPKQNHTYLDLLWLQ